MQNVVHLRRKAKARQEQEQILDRAKREIAAERERALAELRRGAPVVLLDEAGSGALVQAAETASDSGLTGLERLAGSEPLLLLTGQRAAALGLEPAGALEGAVVALELSGRSARRVAELADPTAASGQTLRRRRLVETPPALSASAIDLAKLARLLPAAVLRPGRDTAYMEQA